MYELLLFFFSLSIIPLAIEDFNKYTLSPEYMIGPILLGFYTGISLDINFTFFNVFITLVIIVAVLFLGLYGLWGMGDSYLCLVILIPFSTFHFLIVLIISCLLSLLFQFHKILKKEKVKIPFGSYLTCGCLFISNYLLLQSL